MAVNAYAQYKKQSVMTMTQGEMLLKLYDEVLKQLVRGKQAIQEKDSMTRNAALQKAQRIINYLRATLNFKYDVSNNLAALYDYFNKQIVRANIKGEAALLDEVFPMVQELRDAFCQADKMSKVQNA
ncbi:MAG: flagellar export chaperone FliS [Oscillospiraceae bacterium]|nr:flagellar export chaperone FliS [Oscillospiraceae bacterium]